MVLAHSSPYGHWLRIDCGSHGVDCLVRYKGILLQLIFSGVKFKVWFSRLSPVTTNWRCTQLGNESTQPTFIMNCMGSSSIVIFTRQYLIVVHKPTWANSKVAYGTPAITKYRSALERLSAPPPILVRANFATRSHERLSIRLSPC